MVAAIGHILTPAEILARLKTVDGSGSGLDADLVDALDSTALLGSIAGRSAKTTAYTVVAGDRGYVIECTSGTFTVSLTAAATLGAGFAFTIVNSGSGIITIDPNGSETIRTPAGSGTTAVLAQGQAYTVLCDGTGFNCIATAAASGASGRLAKTSTYTIVAADRAFVIDCTSGTFSVNLTAAATLGAGFLCWVYNSGSGTITLDPDSSETIRDPSGSATTKTLTQGQGFLLMCDGSGWLAITTAVASTSIVGSWGALNSASTVSVTTTTTITSSGANKTHVITGTSADYTVTINASGWSTGDLIAFEVAQSANKLFTISASGLDYKLWCGETAIFRYDGSVFVRVGGTKIPMVYTLYFAGGSSQAISDDTETKVTMFDSSDFFAPFSNYPSALIDVANDKLKTPRKGLIRVRARIALSPGSNTLQYGIVTIKIAGTKVAGKVTSSTTTNGYITLECVGNYLATNTQQDIEVYVTQKAGESRNLGSTQGDDYSAKVCELWVEEVPGYVS